jgi:hypothetical protein
MHEQSPGPGEVSPDEEKIRSLAELLASTDGFDQPQPEHIEEARRSVESVKHLPKRPSAGGLYPEGDTLQPS